MTSAATALEEAGSVKRELAREQLLTSGTVQLRVLGWSMLPIIWPGDELVIERIASHDVVNGDIVLFAAGSRFVAHRVVNRSAGAPTIQTQGDAIRQADAPVSHSELLGRLAFILRDGKCIDPGKTVGFRKRAAAAVFRRSEIAARLVVGVHGMCKPSPHQTSNHRAVPCHS